MYKIIWIICSLAVSISVNCQNLKDVQSGIFTDPRDNNEYNWVKIGDKIWMTENMAYLPKLNGMNQTSDSEPHYYVNGYYGNNLTEAKLESNYKVYGVLYNWQAAKNACPEGWHLASNEEWDQLAEYINSQTSKEKKNSYGDWPGAGKYLKAKSGWHNNKNGSDSFGFAALPGGARNREGYFFLIDTDGNWWTSTESNNNEAWFRYIIYFEDHLFQLSTLKPYGFSVRCVRD